jgi:hypothetical protein
MDILLLNVTVLLNVETRQIEIKKTLLKKRNFGGSFNWNYVFKIWGKNIIISY